MKPWEENNPMSYGQTNMDFNEERFPADSSWRDSTFLVLFAAHFIGIVAILGFGFATPDVPDKDRLFVFSSEWLVALPILVAAAFGFCVVYLQFVKAFPRVMIYLGMAVSMALFAALSLYCFTIGQPGIGAFLLVVTFLFCLYLFFVRSRIPFAVEMITTAVSIVQAYPGAQATAYLSLIVHIAWSSLWLTCLYQASTFPQTQSRIAVIFLTFSFYWVSEVIRNVVHVTVSGVVATWYFLGSSPAMMPENPTLGSLKRALTTSFGSICLGSLIVAVIKTLRSVIRMFGRDNGLAAAVASCILGCLDSLVQYFNHYAFCQVAIYGKTFCTAASDSWELLKRSGIFALANDNIIGGVLLIGCMFCACVVGGVAALLTLAWPSLGSPAALFFVGALIGFVLANLTMQVIDSSIACTFVCFAENPDALRETNSALYDRFMEADSIIH